MNGFCVVDKDNNPVAGSFNKSANGSWYEACFLIYGIGDCGSFPEEAGLLRDRGYRVVPATMNPIIEGT